MNRSTSVSKKRSTARRIGTAEITLRVPAGLVAALDEYAREHGVTRAEAAGMALYSAPEVANMVFGADVALGDVAGP